MWLIIGIGAIIFAILNIVFSFNNKNSKWFGFISLSLTALTVCAFYSQASSYVSLKKIGVHLWMSFHQLVGYYGFAFLCLF